MMGDVASLPAAQGHVNRDNRVTSPNDSGAAMKGMCVCVAHTLALLASRSSRRDSADLAFASRVATRSM